MSDIHWKTVTVRLGDLAEWGPNPRHSTKEQAKRIEHSIDKFGYSQLIEIEPGTNGSKYVLVDGHQRKPVLSLMKEYGPNAEIEARLSDRPFTVDERKEYIALKHKGAQGEWDKDNFMNLYDNPLELMDYGFGKVELWSMGYEFDEGDFDYEEAWRGMPEFDNPEKAYKSINVHFETERDYRNFCNLINQDLTDKTNSVWYPKKEH